jgi:hypothetical protein
MSSRDVTIVCSHLYGTSHRKTGNNDRSGLIHIIIIYYSYYSHPLCKHCKPLMVLYKKNNVNITKNKKLIILKTTTFFIIVTMFTCRLNHRLWPGAHLRYFNARQRCGIAIATWKTHNLIGYCTHHNGNAAVTRVRLRQSCTRELLSHRSVTASSLAVA